MINLGIDFGSTYTLVSMYNTNTQTVETLALDQGNPYIPSVVSYDEKFKRYEFGKGAKSQTGRKGVKIFKAFKMLLTDQNGSERLVNRGYDDENTPEKISGIFLKDLLRKMLDDIGEDKIGNIYIGVPEIWNEDFKTVDGRSIVRNIFQEMDFVENARVVSEPAAASAFFAHNYKTNRGVDFHGNILLVDYGGGTLDITLTNVAACDKSDGDNSVEIKVLNRTGAGENEEGKIGKAGVVYMETIVEQAIIRSGCLEGEELVFDTKFYKVVDQLETELQNRTELIKDIFEEYDQDMYELESQIFTSLDYKGDDIDISYGLLLEVYNETIRDVLDEKLQEMITFMSDNGINWMNRECDDFKIALVGGFGNLYLVKKQIEDKFEISSIDLRVRDIITNRADCERAVSLGTALLANGIIGIRNTAPYSIGVKSYDISTGSVALIYAINYKQDIEFGRVYYPMGTDGNKFMIRSLSRSFDEFIVNFGPDDKTAFVAIPKDEFVNRLRNIIKGQYCIALIGFSMDNSGIISVHIRDYDPIKDTLDEEHTIELTRLNELFKITVVFGGDLQ